MINRLVGLVVVIWWVVMTPSWAQTRVLKGRVLDQVTQRPVPFATVGVPQQPLGTAANEEGELPARAARHGQPGGRRRE